MLVVGAVFYAVATPFLNRVCRSKRVLTTDSPRLSLDDSSVRFSCCASRPPAVQKTRIFLRLKGTLLVGTPISPECRRITDVFVSRLHTLGALRL